MKIGGYFHRGAEGLTTVMNTHSTEMSKSMERLSSGLRINHSGDDSAGKAISEKMRSQLRSLDQSQENTQSAGALLGVAESAVSSIVDIVQEMRTTSIQASSDVLSTDERSALQYKLDQLYAQVDTCANVTSGGRHLLDGTFGKIMEEESLYTGENLTGDLTFKSLSWKADGGESAMHFQVGPDRNDTVLAHLGDMSASKIFKGFTIDVSTTEKAMETVKNLDKSLTRVLYQQVEIGVMQERLEMTSDNLQEVTNNTTAALSTIQDTDMAREVTNFTTHNMLMQATQAMMAQANTVLASFVDLLRPAR